MITEHLHIAVQKLLPIAEAYQATRLPKSDDWAEARHAESYGYEALIQYVTRESDLLCAAKTLCHAMISAGVDGKIPEKIWDQIQDAIDAEDIRRKTLKPNPGI